jgi:hypothetical protein
MAIIKTRLNNWNRGVNKDTPRNLIRDDECADLNNVVHRSGIWTKRPGYTTPYTATGDGFNVIEVVDYIEDDTSTLICATKDSIYYLNGTTWTNRLNLGTTRSDTDKWFFAEGGSQSIACNGLDNVYTSTDPSATNYTAITWDTATVGSSAGTTVTRANIPLFINNRFVLCNVTDGVDGDVPFRIRYTNVLDYDRTEAATGFYDFDDSQTDIISAGVLLNNAIALFKEDMVGIIQNTGSPVFSPALRFTPGIIAPKAWTYIPGGGMFYVSPTGFHMFQGGLPEEVGRNKVRKYFFDQLDESNAANVYCWTNWKEAEVVIHYPTGAGEPDAALVYNWATGVWSTWDYGAYCGFYRFRSQTATNIYYGSASGDVKLSGGADDDGGTITATLETKSYNELPAKTELRPGTAATITNVPNFIQINRIYTDARPITSTVSVGEADYATETPTHNNSATIDEDTGYQPVADIAPTTSAYFSIKVSGFTTVSELIPEWTGAGDI